MCSSYWLDRLADNFVPQSLVVSGTTAFIGGFQWAPAYADRPCQIVVLDLTTGRETGFQERFEAPVYRPAPTFCRHGGGMQLDQSGLWVQETERLWLLDPDRVGHSDAGAPVRRVWRLGKGLRGSTMVRYGDLIGVASFKPGHRGRVSWFKVSDVLAPGVDDLVFTGGDTTDARPVAVGRVPRQLQGVAARGGEVWFSTSGNGCAKLIGPGGKVGFVPGAEGMQFVGNDLWVVSESSARPYNGGRDLVPSLFRLDAPALIASGVGCR